MKADPASFELSPDKALGDFTLLSPVNHEEEFEIGDVPVLFLPVRLETRFAGDELKIRIYPDQVHLDGHAPLLTEREYELGVAFWNRRLDGDADGARDALVAELPPRRAVWVARQMRPTGNVKVGRVFPDLDTRTRTAPTTAALMPERWCAVGFVRNVRAFVAFGATVPHPLACSPDLAELVPYDADGDALPVDEGMAWMVDYERALGVGMAITVDVSGLPLGDDGLTLVVAGVRDEVRSEAALNTLLEAHHYTDGVEVLAQGTATNNTDEGIAGWTATVDDAPALFARELDDEGLAAADGSPAAALASAFGFEDDALLRRLPGADRDEDAAMAAMNRVLWPATWGRYLDDLLAPETGPSIVPEAKHATVREFFVDHVRGGAPLPTLAIGSQPYGLLPLMRRDGGDLNGADPLAALEAVLLDLRERWRESLPAVARLDPVDGGADDETAAEVLGSLPHPGRFVVRRLTWQWSLRTNVWAGLWSAVSHSDHLSSLGHLYFVLFRNLASIEEELEILGGWHDDPSGAGVAADDFDDAQDVLDTFISMCEGHLARQTPLNEWYPDAISGVFDDWVRSDPKIFFADYGNATADRIFNRALVAAPGPTPATYLASLRARVAGFVQAPSDGPIIVAGTTAFARRSATTRSIGAARRQLATVDRGRIDHGPLDPAVPTDTLPMDFGEGEPLLYQLLDAVVDDVPQMQGTAYRAALTTLAERPADELELRLRETLGLASHRLDAWLTALAARALAARREEGREGLRIGGFGWVERLLPDAASTRESQGFVHAPSLAHAATAAVLRAGWNAHGTHDPESLMAVDLRSARVRTAAYLLDGIRQGGALGDLLGCRFERRLHDARVDHFIDPCRRRVLEAAGITRDPRGPVDGLELAALYAGPGVEIDPAEGPSFVVRPTETETAVDRADLQAALEDILASMDAVGDTAIADSVHHLLQGNSARASATVDGIATGAVPPPELRALDTPKPGASVSHRVLVMLGVDAGGASEWGSSPRAQIEPSLERWIAGLLGSPNRIHCAARIRTSGERIDVTFADLVASQGVGALDAAFETEANWRDRARAHVLAQPKYGAHEGDLEVELAPPGLAVGNLAAADFAELTSAVRSLLGRCRPLDARDLALPGRGSEGGADFDEAEVRLDGFRTGLLDATRALETQLPAATEAEPRPVGEARLGSIRAALAALAAYGLPRARPVHGYTEAGRAALYNDAWSALGSARTRLDAASALEAAGTANPEASADSRGRRLHELAAALLGKGFPLLPRFGADAAEFETALDRSDALLEDDPARALGWLRSVGRAREDVGRLDDVITAAELLHDEAGVQPVVGQLPTGADEPWVALEAGGDRRAGKLGLFVIDDGGRARLRAGSAAAGLVVDGWAEVIPTDDVVTGVALDYDAPTSRPPQAMLLALPPEGRSWSFDRVIDTLLEGFEAAKLRAVDPDVLLAYGHQMPAIFPPGHVDAGPQEELVG